MSHDDSPASLHGVRTPIAALARKYEESPVMQRPKDARARVEVEPQEARALIDRELEPRALFELRADALNERIDRHY
jgi:hypothetical protein